MAKSKAPKARRLSKKEKEQYEDRKIIADYANIVSSLQNLMNEYKKESNKLQMMPQHQINIGNVQIVIINNFNVSVHATENSVSIKCGDYVALAE
jgi:hypothetical protein